jgi:hypothetical protein
MAVYKGELAWLDEVDIEQPLRDGPKWPRECVRAYAAAAKLAKEENKPRSEAVYRFLQSVIGIYPSYHNAEQPYSPWISGPTGRSEMPSDFTELDVAAIRQLLERTTDKALRAHLLDMLFVGPAKDYKAAAEAAPLFLELAKELVNANDAHRMQSALRRGIHLARRTAWKKELGQQARDTAFEITRSLDVEPYAYELELCLRLLREEGLGETSEWLAVAQRALAYHKEKGTEDTVQRLGAEVVGFCQLIPDPEAEAAAQREIGESLVRQAVNRATQSGSPFMAAAEILKEGIASLRLGRAPKERIAELQVLLRDYQSRIKDEMGLVSESMDATPFYESTRKQVSGKPFGEALFHLAFGFELTDVTALREQVLESAKQNDFFELFTMRHVDHAGRTKEVLGGLLDAKGADDSLQQRMVHHACRFQWNIRAQVHIDYGRHLIRTEHHPDRESLLPLVANNPFIPTGHEELFLRGFLAGFEGDHILAAHFLVPQFENSLRHVLESNGVHVANLRGDGTEPLKGLEPILKLPEAKDTFGESYLFEINGILNDPAGYNLRNELAHGMLRATQFYSYATVNAWWLMLRLCLESVHTRFRPEPKKGGEGTATNDGMDQ